MYQGVILIGLAVLAQSYSFSERKWKFLLPKDVIQELIELDANSTSDPVGVDQAIDTILRNQSRQDLDQLDLPPYYERLPFVQRWQIKDILFDRQLSYQQKHQMIYDLIHKLAPEQQKFPPVNNAQHSRYFEAFSTLQYQISFTFKLSELKRALPPQDMQSILYSLGNHQINMENKLAEVDRVMTQQSYDTLDRLFFTGVPIVDAEARERFRRLFVEKGFWSMPQQVVQKLTPIHPNCILKPWCNLKYGPKMEENDQKQIQMDQKQEDLLPTPAPISQEAPQHSILIEVQSGDSKPIKQEFSVNPLTKTQTIVVESQHIEVDGRMMPKVNVFVQKNNESVELKADEDGKMDSVETFTQANRNVKVAPQLQNPTLNIPWQLPHVIQPNREFNEKPSTFVGKITNHPTQSTVVVTSEKTLTVSGKIPTEPWKQQVNPPTNEQIIQSNKLQNIETSSTTTPQGVTKLPTTKNPFQPSFPTRWSITRNGPWTRQDEKAFLQKWYQHFGIALSNPGFGQGQLKVVNPVDSKVKLVKEVDGSLIALNPMTGKGKMVIENDKKPETSNPPQAFHDDSSQQKMSPAGEAHFEALRVAHEKLKKDKESDGDSKESQDNKSAEVTKEKEVNKQAFDDPVAKERAEKIKSAIMSPTIKPPTVVINKEAKEKLVVRHSLKGSTLHLEKLTSAELRENDNSTNTTEAPKNKSENDDPNKFLQQPLNDTGSDLLDSLTEGSGDKTVKSDGGKKDLEIKEVPSGLLKLRDVLRRLRERIRQSQSLKNSTFTWQNAE